MPSQCTFCDVANETVDSGLVLQRPRVLGHAGRHRGGDLLAQLAVGRPPYTVAPLFEQALDYFEKAEAIRPHGNDDAILRWNRCVRILQSRLGSDWRKLIETIDAGDSPPI